MQLWSQPVYGLKVSLLRQVHRVERHGSNGVSSIIIAAVVVGFKGSLHVEAWGEG